MTEVEAKRFAGPFSAPPFKHYVQSPIGLVPKDKGKKTRLIFHLSYPRDGSYNSINKSIPTDKCTVKYPSFDSAIRLCILAGRNCSAAKSDMARAFCNVPLMKKEFMLMLMRAKHPITGKWYWFADKCLPFGSSISCKIFQDFSDAVTFLVKHRTNKSLVNYLDDYFFAAMYKMTCDWQVQQFLNVCSEINFPVSLEKTEWGATIIIFLGLLINTSNQTVSLPFDKIQKALEQIEFYLDRTHKKTTVLRAQQICGLLNFLCKCVVPGRAFTTRLYSMAGSAALKSHHHVRITEEHRLDLAVWKVFLQQPDVYCQPFIDFTSTISAQEIDMYSDASGNPELGYGALCRTSFLVGKWNSTFVRIKRPSIEFLELYALTAGVLVWIRCFRNKRICLFVDNESVMHMVNNSSSKCKNCMVLIRLITLESLLQNVRVSAKWVSMENNGLSDSLSRLDFERFRRLGPHMEETATPVPAELIPMSKIWIN